MQISNFLRHCLVLPVLGLFTLLFSPYLHSQSIQVPSIQGPTVPTITVPTVSSPIAPTTPVLSTSTNPSSRTTTTTTSSNSNDVSSSPANSTIPSDLTATALKTLSSFMGSETDSGALGALGDAGSLSSLGNLGSLSSLLGSTDNSIQTTANSASTNALLTQILQKLDTLVTNIDESKLDTTKTTVNNQAAPQILRFSSINATANDQNASVYDILSTCRSIFVSEPESDGTFLLTCDRIYSADGFQQNETFYMLFKAIKTDTFEVAVSVQQNRENKNSILYRLSQHSPLTASRTGNLVTLRSQNPAPQVDLLLDIDFANN